MSYRVPSASMLTHVVLLVHAERKQSFQQGNGKKAERNLRFCVVRLLQQSCLLQSNWWNFRISLEQTGLFILYKVQRQLLPQRYAIQNAYYIYIMYINIGIDLYYIYLYILDIYL